jgi:membrane protease YdiL (CAAX protease family)
LLLGALLLGLSLRATYWALLTVLMWTGIVGNADPNAIAGPILGFACPPLPVLVLSFLTMSLLVPLVEEVVNRGLLLHTLLPMGFTVSVAGSAFLFALAHQPGTYIAAFATGILLAIQTLNARTLWAPLVTHGTYNLAATIDWDCFRIIWNPPASDPALAAVTKIAAPAAVAGIVLCCWLVSKKAIGDRTPRLPGAAA